MGPKRNKSRATWQTWQFIATVPLSLSKQQWHSVLEELQIVLEELQSVLEELHSVLEAAECAGGAA